jgi:hypothetical protein
VLQARQRGVSCTVGGRRATSLGSLPPPPRCGVCAPPYTYTCTCCRLHVLGTCWGERVLAGCVLPSPPRPTPSYRIARTLIAAGASVNPVDEENAPPLLDACYKCVAGVHGSLQHYADFPLSFPALLPHARTRPRNCFLTTVPKDGPLERVSLPHPPSLYCCFPHPMHPCTHTGVT